MGAGVVSGKRCAYGRERPFPTAPEDWNIDCFMFGVMNWKTIICTLDLSDGEIRPRVRAVDCPTRQRLGRAFSRLQGIQPGLLGDGAGGRPHLVRNHRQDPLFEKSAEQRIIWRELLELELHDVDERIERICEAPKDSRQS